MRKSLQVAILGVGLNLGSNLSDAILSRVYDGASSEDPCPKKRLIIYSPPNFYKSFICYTLRKRHVS